MIDLGEAPAPVMSRRRRSRRLLISVLLGVVVIVAGTITAVAVSLHYLHAPGLVASGGGWLPPDNAHARSIHAGQYTASVATPRPGHAQTFQMDFYNPSSVTQTVLGLTDAAELGDARSTAAPVHLTISTKPSFPGDPAALTYSSKPAVIPPHRQFTLRFTQDTGHDWSPCRSESWDGLSLRVRVGVFTRTENLDFDNMIMELRQPGPRC